MTQGVQSLWNLTVGNPWIDPADLAAAVEQEIARGELDFRTRLLIRDSLDALTAHWGIERVNKWLQGSKNEAALRTIWRSDLGEAGFATLRERIMDKIESKNVLQMLGELGAAISQPATVVIGGSIALILAGKLVRGTEDIDIVDEVPRELRQQHELLGALATRYGLRLTHFQSHYLPSGWEQRTHSIGRFGQLDVEAVDPTDIFVGKLFSAREKDRDDLRMLSRTLSKPLIEGRIRSSAEALLGDPALRLNASRNWAILYNEPLPS